MSRAGFEAKAQETAANANSAVDEKQGNAVSETNLHAMCGFEFVKDPITKRIQNHLQTEEECRKSVSALIETAKQNIASSVLTADRNKGLVQLGEALHTIQDRAFHNFEPWPYRGLADALINSPNYMICHAIRDLGVVSQLDLSQINNGYFDVQLTLRIGRQIYLTASGFNHPRSFERVPVGTDRPSLSPGFLGAGGLLGFSFGAPPGSVEPINLPGQEQQPKGESPFWNFVTHGPAARTRAEDASLDFIMQVKTAVEGTPTPRVSAWSDFLGQQRAE